MKLYKYFLEIIRHNVANSILIILLITTLFGWLLYVELNTDGIITGRVVDEKGAPVPEARVLIREKTLNLIKPPMVTETNQEGIFVFKDMKIIEFLINAQKEGYDAGEDVRYHLYFKGQHFTLPKPLILKKSP